MASDPALSQTTCEEAAPDSSTLVSISVANDASLAGDVSVPRADGRTDVQAGFASPSGVCLSTLTRRAVASAPDKTRAAPLTFTIHSTRAGVATLVDGRFRSLKFTETSSSPTYSANN